jgi:hypothetical protein
MEQNSLLHHPLGYEVKIDTPLDWGRCDTFASLITPTYSEWSILNALSQLGR